MGSTRSGEEVRRGIPLKAVIADDEPRARQFLEKLLGEHEDVEVIGVATSGSEALSTIMRLKPDVAFLDIHMPDLSGLEVARHLGDPDSPLVVFVTAYDRYAIEAFEIAALGRRLIELGAVRAGAAELSAACGIAGRGENLVSLADAYARLGALPEALSTYRLALRRGVPARIESHARQRARATEQMLSGADAAP